MADLSIQGLTKAFGDRETLRSVDLAVQSGEMIAILGASGSGKTTLLRLICGFEQADAGTIEIDGQRVCERGNHIRPEHRHIGYVAQDGALFPHISVGANVLFGLPRSLREDRFRAEALLELVGLNPSYATRSPHELSGGEQQRVALARALAPDPKLILLDEPFSALDSALRMETRRTVGSALAAAGATALLVTHDQAEALSMGDRVAVLRDGIIAQFAMPQALYRRPIDADLAQFVGEAVFLSGLVDGGHACCILGRLPLAKPIQDGSADIMVRPEQIRLSTRNENGELQATVMAVTYFGHDAAVTLSTSESGLVLIARVPGHKEIHPGSCVWLRVDGPVMAYQHKL